MQLNSFSHNSKIIVFGASGAIGEAIVNEFLEFSTVEKIYAISRSSKKFDDQKVITKFFDYNDENSLKTLADEINQEIDIVFIATGLLHDENLQPEKSIRDLNINNLQQNFLVNTIGPALIAKYFLSKLKKDSKAVFASISARVSSISDNQLGGWYGYRASKSALNMIIKNLAIENNRQNNQKIIIGLHPGTVQSKLSQPFTKNYDPNKLFTPQFSAKCLIKVLENLQKEDSGKIFAWDQQEIAP